VRQAIANVDRQKRTNMHRNLETIEKFYTAFARLEALNSVGRVMI
jgi:hypothetical protein